MTWIHHQIVESLQNIIFQHPMGVLVALETFSMNLLLFVRILYCEF